MTEPKRGDRVQIRYGDWLTIDGFSEDSGTRLSDGRWVCASAFYYVSRLGGTTYWQYLPEGRPEVGGWDWVNGKGRGNGDSLRPVYLPGEASTPCFICGEPDDHLGLPHGTVTGDGRVRADVTKPVPVPVPKVDLGLCARIVELEAELANGRDTLRHESERANEAIRREEVLEEVVTEYEETITMLERQRDELAGARSATDVMVDNNRLRRELLAQERAGAGLKGELDKAIERLAQVEEALDSTGTFEDVVGLVAEALFQER